MFAYLVEIQRFHESQSGPSHQYLIFFQDNDKKQDIDDVEVGFYRDTR